MVTETSIINTEQIKAEIAPVIKQASAIIVSSPEQYSFAAAFLKNLKDAQRKVTDFFGPIKDTAHKAWKTTVNGESTLLDPLKSAEVTIKRKMLDYQTEQERIRQEQQRKLQAEADERARKERERLQREAAALKTPELKEARLEQAAAVVAPVVTVASNAPQIKGQSIRKTWKARVVDISIVPREYLVINDTAIQGFARATKGAVKIPGIEFYEESTLSSTSR